MNLKEGDTLVKDTKTWEITLVTETEVRLDTGEFVDIEQIEKDVKHDRTRVFHSE